MRKSCGSNDEAVSSSLLKQGVPKEVIAVAFTNTDISEDGRSLLAAAGLGKQTEIGMRPFLNQFQLSTFCSMLCAAAFLLLVLFLETEAIVPAGGQSIDALHQWGLLLSFTAEL